MEELANSIHGNASYKNDGLLTSKLATFSKPYILWANNSTWTAGIGALPRSSEGVSNPTPTTFLPETLS